MRVEGDYRPQPVEAAFDAGQSGAATNINTEAEQQDYRKLFERFFQKLTRWRDILADKQFLVREGGSPLGDGFGVKGEHRAFYVIATKQDSRILVSAPKTRERDVIVRLSRDVDNDEPEFNSYSERYSIAPGQAARGALVDINGEPIELVEITVNKFGLDDFSQWLSIYAKIATIGDDPHMGPYDRIQVDYDVTMEEVSTSRGFAPSGKALMSDAYAAHLFTTIDAVIPPITGTQGPHDHSELPPDIP